MRIYLKQYYEIQDYEYELKEAQSDLPKPLDLTAGMDSLQIGEMVLKNDSSVTIDQVQIEIEDQNQSTLADVNQTQVDIDRESLEQELTERE